MPRFLCLWIPHFAAWAAVYSDPSLQNRPVIAHRGGRVVAVSPLAEQGGAEVGWTLPRAQAQLGEAAFWPVHGPTVNALWSEVLGRLLELTPCLESVRPGLLLADVRPPQLIVPLLRQWQDQGQGQDQWPGQGSDTAYRHISRCGHVQAGVADDRATAEVAAFTAAPGTLRAVRVGQSATFLRRVPLQILCCAGLRPDTLERLGWFGWAQIGDICHLSQRQLLAQFDQGALLYRYAQASDRRPVGLFRQPPSVSAAFTFERPVQEPCEWEPVLGFLVEQAITGLKERGAQTVALEITTHRGLQRAHRVLHAQTSEERALYEAAHSLLTSVLGNRVRAAACVHATARDSASDSAFAPTLDSPIQLFHLQLTLGELSPLPALQGRLFGRERPGVGVAVRAMAERFPGALQRIVMLDRCAYLPETAFRLDAVTTENIENEVPKSKGAPKPKGGSRGRPKAGRAGKGTGGERGLGRELGGEHKQRPSIRTSAAACTEGRSRP